VAVLPVDWLAWGTDRYPAISQMRMSINSSDVVSSQVVNDIDFFTCAINFFGEGIYQ
jgi:hypothetical protein